MIAPGATIGIIGGGQLGRMLAMAAAGLGYRCYIYCPDEDSPAAEVSAHWTRAAYDDEAALAAFAAQVDVVTYEFENIPAAPLLALGAQVPLHPHPRALEIAQDRLTEKTFLSDLGIATARFAAVDDRAGLDAALAEIGAPAILKTRRFGYDGKGQARIMSAADADAAWAAMNGRPAILEAMVDFEQEYSILLARAGTSDGGATVSWDAPHNIHRNGILDTSTVPAAGLIAEQAADATAIAARVAAALDYVGVLTLEFFATRDGPLVNEMAPRVHNSGHWTIEGAATSQFENHIRAVCGLPLGSTGLVAKGAAMTNLIGADVDAWPALLAEPGAHLHLYGKDEGRPGRKMGHVTRLIR